MRKPHKAIQFLSLFLASQLGLAPAGMAAVYVADSASKDDVQAAINLTTHGDTVEVPAGTATWDNLQITNRIWLKGPGAANSLITLSWPGSGSGDPGNILFRASSPGDGTLSRLSGFTFAHGSNGSVQSLVAFGFVSSSNVIFRVHDCVFTNLVRGGIQPQGWASGVIDNCEFYGAAWPNAPTAVRVQGWITGTTSWGLPPYWGSTNGNVYVEDCKITFAGNANGALDSYRGARWVFRYNTVTNVNVGNHGLDSTGADSTHTFEVYSNRIVNATSGNMTVFSFRGGTGPIYGNTTTGKIEAKISLQNYRSSGTNIYGGTTACCNPWGAIGSTNVYDGPGDYPERYPPYQQIGQAGPITNYPSGGPGGSAYRQGATVPVYVWGNTANGTNMTAIVGNNYLNTGDYAYIPMASDVLVEDRDFVNGTEMPDYTPLEYPHPLRAALDGEEPPPSETATGARISGGVILQGATIQ